MKPLYIHMKNIGPFVDEELDFTKLEEVFLLCGDTGAGKTTIFDAMTFALYGEFLGARKGKAKDFRSQFSKGDEESSVVFEFSSDGEKYRVKRTLPRPYVNRNGKAVDEPSQLSVELWNRKEEKYEMLNAGKKELDSRLAEIVGLSAPEFSKIVVLPQGEFSEFLRSNSNVKQDILKKLFPVDFYHSIVEKVKEKNDVLQGQIKLADAEIKSLLKETDFTDAEEKIASFEKELKENRDELKKLRLEKESLDKSNTKLESELKTAAELEKSVEEKELLEKKVSDIEELEKKLLLSDDADLLFPFIDGKNSRQKEYESAKAYLEETAESADGAKERYDVLKGREKEIAKVEKSLDENKILLKGLRDRLLAAEKYAEVYGENKAAKEKLKKAKNSLDHKASVLKELESSLSEKATAAGVSAEGNAGEVLRLVLESFSRAKEKEQSDSKALNQVSKVMDLVKNNALSEKKINELSAEKDECSKQIENSEKLLAEYKATKEEQTTKNMAFSIVSYLKPGCPCPVCGSEEHPSPAKAPKGFLDLDGKIAVAERSIKVESERKADIDSKIAVEKSLVKKNTEELSGIDDDFKNTSLEEAEKKADLSKEEMYRLQDIKESSEKLVKDIDDVNTEIQELNELVSAAKAECASVAATLKALEEQVKKDGGDDTDPEKIGAEISGLESLLEKQNNQVASYKKEYEDAGLNLEKFSTKRGEAENALAVAEKNLGDAKSVLTEKLRESKFGTEEEALVCFIKKSEKSELKEEVKNFRDEQTRLEASIKVLSAKVSEKHSVLLERAEKLADEISSLEDRIAEDSEKGDGILSAKNSYEKDYGKFREKSEELLRLENDGKSLARLCRDLSGNNPSRIQFETWFLGLYFDDVVVCANNHLLKISGERYEFKMDTDRTGGNAYHGLDLVVHDYQVNKDRDTATLSGGETFMASISLALGLTEVVQKTSRLDSLFIDEGFGSLDKESLDMAVGVLQDIGNTRTVGVISHVEEMLDAIACHVNVKKTREGSHISL